VLIRIGLHHINADIPVLCAWRLCVAAFRHGCDRSCRWCWCDSDRQISSSTRLTYARPTDDAAAAAAGYELDDAWDPATQHATTPRHNVLQRLAGATTDCGEGRGSTTAAADAPPVRRREVRTAVAWWSGYKKMRTKMAGEREWERAGMRALSLSAEATSSLCGRWWSRAPLDDQDEAANFRWCEARLRALHWDRWTDRQTDRADVASTTVAAGLGRKEGRKRGREARQRMEGTAWRQPAARVDLSASEVDGVERSSMEGVTEDDSSEPACERREQRWHRSLTSSVVTHSTCPRVRILTHGSL